MPWPKTLCRGAAIAVLLLPWCARAQDAGELQRLIVAEQAAVQGGDLEAILKASRAVADMATTILVTAAAAAHHPEQTAELQRQMAFADGTPESAAALVTSELQAGRTADAREDAAAAVGQIGDSAGLRLALAGAMHAGDDLNETIHQLQQAIVLAPNAGVIHLALGEALWELNEQQYSAESLAELVRAEQLQPADFATQYNLGVQLAQFHQFDSAATHLRHAAEIDSTSPDPWLQLGLAAYAQNQPEEATRSLQRCVALTGSNDARNGYQVRLAYVALSRLDVEAGRVTDAAEALARAEDLRHRLESSGASTELSQSTALPVSVVRKVGKPEPGRTDAAFPAVSPQLVAELRSLVAKSANDGGTALARQHNYALALIYFRWAAQADPRFDPVERNLGLAALRAGLYEESVTALQLALTLHADDALAAKYLAEAKSAAGAGR